VPSVIFYLFIFLWSPYGIGQTIIFSYCGLFFFLLFSSPNLSRRRLDVCHTSTHGVALRCRSETCSMRLAENTGRKKSLQKSPSAHHCTTLSGYIFATKARIDNRKKNLDKQQYVFHMFPRYGELRPTSG